jgi:hypothetical protein
VICLGIVVARGLGAQTAGAPGVPTAAAVFAWEPFLDQPATVRARELSGLQSAGVDTLYVSIDRYAELYEAPPGRARAGAIAVFDARLRTLVRAAAARGLRVEALAGNPRWGNADQRYLPLLLVRYVRRFNAEAPSRDRLSGINFDVEPYAQPDFAGRRTKLLAEYLETVRRLVAAAGRAPALAVGLDMPPWFFSDAAGTSSGICWLGACKPVGWHALDALAARPANYAVVMAYRNFTSGPDGSIALARPAFAYAARNRLTVGVRVGQETHAVEPAHITFAGKGLPALQAAVARIARTFGPDPNFRGIAINDLRGLLSL